MPSWMNNWPNTRKRTIEELADLLEISYTVTVACGNALEELE